MLYILMGQSCTGKSTVVEKLKEQMDVEVFSGKDYLRLAKSESAAWNLFYEKLLEAASSANASQTPVVYVVTEKDLFDKVCSLENAYKVKFTASLDVIKSRFAQRMGGHLPPPVEKMLERQHAIWDAIEGDQTVDTTDTVDPLDIVKSIMQA